MRQKSKYLNYLRGPLTLDENSSWQSWTDLVRHVRDEKIDGFTSKSNFCLPCTPWLYPSLGAGRQLLMINNPFGGFNAKHTRQRAWTGQPPGNSAVLLGHASIRHQRLLPTRRNRQHSRHRCGFNWCG